MLSTRTRNPIKVSSNRYLIMNVAQLHQSLGRGIPVCEVDRVNLVGPLIRPFGAPPYPKNPQNVSECYGNQGIQG
jgi:hypothetical protein